jgi:hypothetical protein
VSAQVINVVVFRCDRADLRSSLGHLLQVPHALHVLHAPRKSGRVLLAGVCRHRYVLR